MTALTQTPDISVVIPVSGRHAYLQRSLTTLVRQDCVLSEITAELIVIDDADDARARGRTLGVCNEVAAALDDTNVILRYVRGSQHNRTGRNCGYARNVGIRLARAPIVLMSDGDMLHVTETLLQHVEAHATSSNLQIFSFCRDCPPDIPLSTNTLARAAHDERYALRMAAHTDWYGGGCCSVRRETAVRVGGFDESFTRWGFEDYDFSRRLRYARVAIRRDDRIVSLHQMHPVEMKGAWRSKLRAAAFMFLRVNKANNRRRWGVPEDPPMTLRDIAVAKRNPDLVNHECV